MAGTKHTIREKWLAELRNESRGHPGTMEICGRAVNLDDIEEVRVAMFWIATTSTELLTSLSRATGGER